MTSSAHLDSLYPFLADDAPLVAHEDLVSAARRSTADKLAEAALLRARLLVEAGPAVACCGRALAESFKAGATLFAMGNGGSSTDAAAVARLFMVPDEGVPLPAVALLSDVAVTTALANDIGFHAGASRHLAALAREGDIALGLSTSGDSENLLEAFAEARRRNLTTVGFAGHDGGLMAREARLDHVFVVRSSSVHRIQEAQTTLYNLLWQMTQASLAELDDMSLPDTRRRMAPSR